MLTINTKGDARTAEDFPNDPYANLTITTATQKLYLQLAFLSMDSGYFAKIDPDTREIDLQDLKEEPLLKVLHSLYGEQLVASSPSELIDLYEIITYLEIEDYEASIKKQVAHRKDIHENIEFLEFSFKNGLCWKEVLDTHIENKLKVLEDSKNYLQLSKLSNEAFDTLLIEFVEREDQSEAKAINNAMENFFNRKQVKPIMYLKEPHLAKLQAIWLKYHHVPPSQLTPKSSPAILNANSFDSNSSPLTPPNVVSLASQAHSQFSQLSSTGESIEDKRSKVAQMEKAIASKDETIQELSQKIDALKRQLGFRPEPHKSMTTRSFLIQVEGDQSRPRKQSKRLEDLLGEGHSDNQSITDQRKRNSEVKDSNIMHRLGSKNLKRI